MLKHLVEGGDKAPCVEAARRLALAEHMLQWTVLGAPKDGVGVPPAHDADSVLLDALPGPELRPRDPQRVLAELLPHFVCEYVYELATVFSEFYDTCKVVDNGVVNVSRVLFIEATRQVFLRCFKILGLRPLERM